MNNLERLKRTLLGRNPDQPLSGRQGRDGDAIPDDALTLISYDRLNNIEEILREVVAVGIPGNVIETGVWKGGAVILMREVLNALQSEKIVYVADSFDGVPPPNPTEYPIDAGDYHHCLRYLAIPQEQVEDNFRAFSTLDGVKFVKGWFKDTLHLIDDTFCFIRLDGDLYESTMNAMSALYPRLSVGGYCVIDDWGGTATAAPAVIDYMKTIGARHVGSAWVHDSGEPEQISFCGPAAVWKKLT